MEYLIHDHFKAIIAKIQGLKQRHQELGLDRLSELSESRRAVWGIADSIIIVEGLTDDKQNGANNKTILAWVPMRPSFGGYRREQSALEFLAQKLDAKLQLESVRLEKQWYPSPVPSQIQNLFRKPSRKRIKRKLGNYDKPIGKYWLPELRDPKWQTDPMLQEWYSKMQSQILELAKDYLRAATTQAQSEAGRADNELPAKPAEPSQGSSLQIWLDYYHTMKESGFKISFRAIAEKSGYAEGTFKNAHEGCQREVCKRGQRK